MGFKKGKARESLSIGRLDELFGSDHPVRLMDLLVEKVIPQLSGQINEVGHNEIGASAYDRKSLLKLYLYGYYNGIQSSRKLEQETYRNLEVIWLMEDLRPDHKTISDFRKDHGEQIRQVVRHFSWFLKNRGYLEASEISIDGMRLKANTNRDTLSEEKIDKRLGRLNRQITIYLKKLALNDAIDEKEENLERLAVEERKAVEMIAQLQGEIEELLKKKTTSEIVTKSMSTSRTRKHR